jgi:recombinational DNA repair protein (RecF pathway)
MLQIGGHQPMLDACVDCGRKVPVVATRFSFCSTSGGIICSSCRPGKSNLISFSREALDWMTNCLDEIAMTKEISERARVEVRQILNQFENSLAGFRLPAQSFLS